MKLIRCLLIPGMLVSLGAFSAQAYQVCVPDESGRACEAAQGFDEDTGEICSWCVQDNDPPPPPGTCNTDGPDWDASATCGDAS